MESDVLILSNHAAPLQGMISNVKSGSLGAIIRSFKSAVTRRAERELNSGNIWQRNYYEHIIRDQTDWERITAYITDNPLHWVDDQENPVNIR
jgi:REP element-mobilizing transposase RayT